MKTSFINNILNSQPILIKFALKLFLCKCLSFQTLLLLGLRFPLTLSLPNATAVEFTVHCQTRLQSKCKGTFDRCLFLTVIKGASLCSLSQNVQET